MKNEHRNELKITPTESYEVPKIPTLEEANADPVLLKKLPSRWKRNAAVVACVGVMGIVTLAGSSNLFSHRSRSGFGMNSVVMVGGTEINLRTHGGGGGSAPFYIVNLTEQEALGIIREQLEAVGLNFNAVPPEYIASIWGWGDISIDLFDEENHVAVVKYGENSRIAERVAEEFAQNTDNLVVGAFYNPRERFGVRRPSTRVQRRAILLLKENLTEQVQAFIAVLQEQGILE